MFETLDMPVIAIAGGFVLLFLLACVALLARRARPSAGTSRRTSFHLAVFDPAIAAQGRAAWEGTPSEIEVEDAMVEDISPVIQHTSIGHAPSPRRLARGSTPAIHPPAYTPMLPARPLGWGVPVAPSVTARMRAARRG